MMNSGKEQRISQRFRSVSRSFGRLMLAAVPILSMLAVLPSSCGNAKNRRDLAVRMAAEEGAAAGDERIAELKGKIASVDAQVEKTLEGVRDKATYWRLLGLKYMDYQMWGEALKAFDEAAQITPEYAVLLYNRGLCAGQMALSADVPGARSAYIDRAEANYRRAVAVDPRYTPALYGLAVLLVFERNNPAEAVDLLDDFLAIERSDVSARFLLARCYVQLGRSEDALILYGEIIKLTEDDTEKSKAEDLYRRVSEGNYGT